MARRGENIYKRKDGRYEGRYIKGKNMNGKSMYGYVYDKTYLGVKNKLEKAKTQITPPNETTVRNAVAFWLKCIKPQIKASTYAKYYNTAHRHIVPVLGNVTFSNLTTNVVQRFVENKLMDGNLRGKGALSAKTVTDMLAMLKQIIKYNCSLTTVPCDFSAVHIGANKKSIRCFSYDERNKILCYLSSHFDFVSLGIWLCFYTGLRIGEICALRFNDIIPEYRILRVNKTMQRIQIPESVGKKTKIVISLPKSEKSIRDIPYPEIIEEYIQRCGACAPDAYVLTGCRDHFIEPRTLENRFKKILKNCQIENATFHMIRHTFATNCIESGVDAKSLSEILGHANVNITLQRYVHSSIEMKIFSMNKLFFNPFFSPSKLQSQTKESM